jgi:hypothetical protein
MLLTLLRSTGTQPYIKVTGVWQLSVVTYIKIAGGWQPSTSFYKVANVWK